MALQICDSVNPANAAPVTVNEALSPGSSPSFTEPPLKLPEGPVVKPKSNTTLLKPAGTLPRSASEKLKVEDKLGACEPVKPFSPDALALPSGGKSNPIPVIVDVDPGDVIADVFVMVKVNVLVCALNEHCTVAVEARPEFTPTMLMVSALTVALTPAITKTAASASMYLLNRDIEKTLLLVRSFGLNTSLAGFLLRLYKWGEKLAGQYKSHYCVCVLILKASAALVNE